MFILKSKSIFNQTTIYSEIIAPEKPSRNAWSFYGSISAPQLKMLAIKITSTLRRVQKRPQSIQSKHATSAFIGRQLLATNCCMRAFSRWLWIDIWIRWSKNVWYVYKWPMINIHVVQYLKHVLRLLVFYVNGPNVYFCCRRCFFRCLFYD